MWRSEDEGVLLRFVCIHNIHINVDEDYEAAWLNRSVVLLLENNSMIWLDDDGGRIQQNHLAEIKKYTTWVEADRLFGAITDAEGNPVEMPIARINQVWVTFGVNEKKHFE